MKQKAKREFLKREIFRIGKLSFPAWMLIAIAAISITGAASVVTYYATVAHVTQTSNVISPIVVNTFAINGISDAVNASASGSSSFTIPAGSSFIFYVNVSNRANRPVNTTIVNIVNESQSSGYELPVSVYYLGSAANVLVGPSVPATPNSILAGSASCPGTASSSANNIVSSNESIGNYYNILNALYAKRIPSNFYTYNVPASGPSGQSIFGTNSNSITSVCNWIGNQTAYMPSNSVAYYYLLGNPLVPGQPPVTQNSVTGQLVFPSNAFSYYMPGNQPTYVLGVIMPATYNGIATITTKAVVSSMALSNT
ncbi:hypothetical protein M1373_00935 [Candidatus Marsarchaeota archaeon]|nr:hypothetical protein [Candidatus Marsarchaeota archaeon]MCL5404232.1 hypothetical protein [Candidatus Marsarchaeota archaeon]